MKGITLCSDCAYYSMKKHRCTRGATDPGKPTDSFYADCPLDDVEIVVRCKDCKHSGMYCFGTSKEETLACLEIEEDGFVRFATAVPPDHFCACGERRNDHA